MTIYGFIRTSRDQEPGHPGSDPQVQRRQVVEAGVDAAHIYADVAASGAKDYSSRSQWHVLDELLALGDVLAVAAIDRLGRRYLDTMWAIYDLQRRGIRLRSLADNEVQWTQYLDAEPASAKGVELGRPRRLTDELLIAIRQDVEEGMPVVAVALNWTSGC